MFSKLFQKAPQEQRPLVHPQQHNEVQGSFTSGDLDPKVVLHYGVPSTASILAFDHVQRLLALGTLDGRIKVIGGDNIEGILFSPKHSSFKHLEFLQNQGFLVSVSNDNEIQVWDLESRKIASILRWESTITAFSVIYGTSYMYIGTEYGMVYVLKFDSEDRKINILPYYVPTNVIAEAAGMSLDNVSVIRVLHQPCSQGNRLLIAYENGVLVLWDASEDKVVLIRGHRNLELKEKKKDGHPNNSKDVLSDNKLDHEEEKEISSICWASNNGSVVAVGYVDGDIMFWDLSTADSSTGQRVQKMSNHVVKLQLSSADRRLPVIVLHWCANRSNNKSGGLIFVYGGDEIGSEEVLTVLSVDWSSGIESLKCTGRIDVTLNGSFADMVLLASDCPSDRACNMLYVLTNPGQLHLYDNACLCSLMSQQEKNASVPSMQYPMVIPTLEPYMTTAKLGVVYGDGKPFRALSEIVLAAKQHEAQDQTSTGIKWPLTGGVPGQIFKDLHVLRIYIAGYQDGSVRIWDATYPALSLVYNMKPEVNGVKIDGASAAVSALDFCPDTLKLAVGNECGLVRLYGLIGSSDETTVHFVTENENKVQNMHKGNGLHCTAVFSLQSSRVCDLKFANFGGKLVVGYECGRVALLDTSKSSVIFLTKVESDASSPVISLNVKFSDSVGLPNSPQESVSNISDNPGKGLIFNMTRDAQVVAIDTESGNIVCNVSINPKKESNVISIHIIDGTAEPSSGKFSSTSPQSADSRSELMQANVQSEGAPVVVEAATTVENSYFGKILNKLILLCYESELSLHSLKSVIEGCSKYIRKVNLVKRCCWTTILKKDEKECGLVVLYQTGDIELRSLPTLEVVGECSLMSMLRWSLNTNMKNTICSSSNGQLILVNGNETAFISLLKHENEFRIPESLPSLHDKVLAAAVDATASLSSNQNEKQGAHAPAILISVIKNLKGGKEEEKANQEVYLANLERLFSDPPFLKSSSATVDKQDTIELNIDEIHIDEPLVVISPQECDTDKRDKGKGTEKEKLLEGASIDTKPRQRTADEIKAKYRKAGDASAAAALAKEKLLERQEKLQMLSQHTEELQSGAEDFASMAKELAKRMENRKWWQI
ncbi:lethal(2) giant larvae protein-like protein SRO77 isoform X1 [Senna tora]|uniref:Lethal(2) giant larvae protein-like protein SRO77 isoform X1 n=1 Tax=Senna tora TaxID=362788 RepID=A0A834U271_9FABA|nr:lethal(2) giant larvae protein-like protein SRO77 isoform X1 [Senna tora]